MDLEGRHPATQQIARHFAYDHLPEPQQTISAYSHHLAEAMIRELPDGPELTTGLRKLLEAKDCFVRASLPATGEPLAAVPSPSTRPKAGPSDPSATPRHRLPRDADRGGRSGLPPAARRHPPRGEQAA